MMDVSTMSAACGVLCFMAIYAIPMCTANRTNYQLGLMNHLMENYGHGYARPVQDGHSPTTIVFRCLLNELIEMNTREQTLKISVSMKMTWKDEFLAWNISEWGNITAIHIPAHAIWFPDITLYNNVYDNAMMSLPENMHANVNADGTVKWLSPAILTSSCNQRVKYFPFDTQVCLLRFASWSSHMEQIDFWPENGIDAVQTRFLEDGTWKFLNVNVERRIIDYGCCPRPFTELFYHVLFRRRPDFYIIYLIVPCCLLSFLALTVFYLPPDCGEKVTLSITNLLALVVFQQLISETMPPSPDASPIIGTYFTIIIVMVCSSVLVTVLVIHVGFKTCPMPKWTEWIFLDVIGTMLCISTKNSYQQNKFPISENIYDNAAIKFPTSDGDKQEEFTDPNNVHLETCASRLAKISDVMEKFELDKQISNSFDEIQKKWKLLATILDRCLLYSFVIVASVTTVYLMSAVVFDSEEDYEELFDTWFGTNDSIVTSE